MNSLLARQLIFLPAALFTLAPVLAAIRFHRIHRVCLVRIW